MAYIITREQIKRFDQAAFENYITTLVERCHISAPYLKPRITEEQLRQILKQQVSRMATMNFTQQGTVTFLIDMMLAYGYRCFDDPQYPWIAHTLAEYKSRASEADRSMPLYHAVVSFIQETGANDQAYLSEVLSELNSLRTNAEYIGKAGYAEEMSPLLAKISPRKTRVMGEDTVTKLVAYSVKRSEETYGLRQPVQIMPITLSMFLFGHQFDTDPFRPFISMDELKGPYGLDAAINNMAIFLGDKEKIIQEINYDRSPYSYPRYRPRRENSRG